MGSFLLLRRSAIGSAPPLDEGYFMYGEECDMCRQLLQKGWRTVHVPHASLIHVHGGSAKTPEMQGWAAEAKARGVLRYLWKWRGMPVAWAANFLMLLGLTPRFVAWGLADLVRSLKSGRLRARMLHKGSVVWFHVAVLFRPRTIQQNWGGPDAIRTDHE